MGLLKPPPGVDVTASLRSIPTNWEALAGIDDRSSVGWESKWEHLIRTYRAAMLRYAERILRSRMGSGYDRSDAEDCVDGFLAGCVQGPVLSVADPRIAPFRAFLQDRLRKHALKYVRSTRAKKRRSSGGRRLVSVDALAEVGAEPAAAEIDASFDRDWVEALYADALARLAASPRRAQYVPIVESLRRSVPLEDVTPSVRHRARKAFADAFRAALRDTLPHDAFEGEEWGALAKYLP